MNGIEAFISQNIDELSKFSDELLPSQLLRLLEIYNRRVEAVESDRSMLIEIPTALARHN